MPLLFPCPASLGGVGMHLAPRGLRGARPGLPGLRNPTTPLGPFFPPAPGASRLASPPVLVTGVRLSFLMRGVMRRPRPGRAVSASLTGTGQGWPGLQGAALGSGGEAACYGFLPPTPACLYAHPCPNPAWPSWGLNAADPSPVPPPSDHREGSPCHSGPAGG